VISTRQDARVSQEHPMNPLHDTFSDEAARGPRFITLVAAAPIAALTLGVFAFSALQIHPDGHPAPLATHAATQTMPDATPSAPAPLEPMPTAEDMEMLSYRTYGG
jgi:hypothetical protein